MAIRFDYNELKLRSPYKTHDGQLVCDATFARDGILEYRQPDGKTRRELRLPEENQKALTKFGLAPVTIEHPPVLITEDNAEQYRKGVSLGNVQYGKGGFVSGVVTLMDSAAIEYAASGGAEISAGYTCDIEPSPGVWKGQHYDAIQRNIEVNHLAITKKGRAGPDVRLHLDSDSAVDFAVQISPTSKPRMATLRIDSIEYDIPEALAPVLGPKIRRLDELEAEVREVASEKSELAEQLEQVTQERDRLQGRSDAQEVCLGNAEIILSDLGYVRDSYGDYIRTDMKKKPAVEVEIDMEDEDMEMDMEDEEKEDMAHSKHKSKKKDGGYMKKMDAGCEKKDSTDIRMDAKSLMLAWKEADQLAGSALSGTHFDSAESPADVRRLVVAHMRPSWKERLDSMTEAAIDGIYDFIKEESASKDEPRTDAQQSYSGELRSVIGAAREATPAPSKVGEVSNAYTQPLSLSR